MGRHRVILVGAEWYADLLASCRGALSQLGVEVQVVPTNSVPWVPRGSRFGGCAARIPVVGPRLQRYWAGRHRGRLVLTLRKQLDQLLQEWRPDLLIYVLCWGEPACHAMLAGLDVQKVGWLMDDPFQHDGSLAAALSCFDRIYVVDEAWAANVRLASGCGTRVLTCGADLDINKCVSADQVPAELRCDLLFVGTSYRNNPAGILRSNLLGRIADLGLRVYGDSGWAQRPVDDPLRKAYHGRELTSREANLAYNGARIVINIHHPQFCLGTSLRTFAVAAATAFQLVDERPGMSRFFAPGKEVGTYSSPDDLRDKVLYYLKHESARQALAQAGFERVCSEHSYAHRLAEILTDAGLPVPAKP